jgi:hypothetical protein
VLTPVEWRSRKSGAISIDIVESETHVTVRDPDGEVVSVTGTDEVLKLIALANHALPDDDPRKICRSDLAVLSVLIDRIDRRGAGGPQLLGLAETLYDKLAALLPPPQRPSPSFGTHSPSRDT